MEDAGFQPDPWQRRVLDSTHQELLLLCGRQTGKALDVDTDLPTPSGWVRMGDVQPGDSLLDEKGRPCVVLACSPVEWREAFRVSFSDGSSIVADGEHLWTTLDKNTRKAMGRLGSVIPNDWPSWQAPGRPTPKGRGALEADCTFSGCEAGVLARGLCTGHYQQQKAGRTLTALRHPRSGAATLTTLEMGRTLSSGQSDELNHSIPTPPPLDLPDADLPIPPYTLGAWLGDGHSAGGRITQAVADIEVMSRIEADGYALTPYKVSGNGKTGCWNVIGLARQLRLAGLKNDKHIPQAYLRSSPGQRLDLLRGLMDTDGTAAKKTSVSSCEFTTTSHRLAGGMMELLASLGIVARITEGVAKLRGRDIGPKWRILFSPTIQPFHLARKADRVDPSGGKQAYRRLRYVCSVEPVGPRMVRCVRVSSPSSLYLAGRAMIPTHNSTAAGALALMTALREPGSLTLLLSPSARQSGELLQAKVMPLYRAIARQHPSYVAGGGTLVREMVMSLEFKSGSRIIALPENPDGIVGYSGVSLLVIDEASRVSDELFFVTRPMLATSQGRIICLSTPKGKRGFFFAEWEGGFGWEKISARASECPRIPASFLAEERKKLGDRWYDQEYENAFNDSIGSLFSHEDIEAAISHSLEPLDLNINPIIPHGTR